MRSSIHLGLVLAATHLATAQDSSRCLLGLLCVGKTPQCTVDNHDASICCAKGQKALNGKCYDFSANLCSDGSVCSGEKSQCTDNMSYPHGPRLACCKPGQFLTAKEGCIGPFEANQQPQRCIRSYCLNPVSYCSVAAGLSSKCCPAGQHLSRAGKCVVNA